jgi:hypothetical protein
MLRPGGIHTLPHCNGHSNSILQESLWQSKSSWTLISHVDSKVAYLLQHQHWLQHDANQNPGIAQDLRSCTLRKRHGIPYRENSPRCPPMVESIHGIPSEKRKYFQLSIHSPIKTPSRWNRLRVNGINCRPSEGRYAWGQTTSRREKNGT